MLLLSENTGEASLRGAREELCTHVALASEKVYRYHAKSLSRFYTIFKATGELNSDRKHARVYLCYMTRVQKGWGRSRSN